MASKLKITRTERQAQVIENWKRVNCRGVFEGCTGFGKTRIGLNAIERVQAKNPTAIVVVIVPTEQLQEQWIRQLNDRNLTATVLIINTAASKQFNCDFLVCDEIHRYASDYFSKVFENCNPTFILGLTGTYERLDGKEKMVIDKICPLFDAVPIEVALANGWVAEYVEYKVMIDVDLNAYNNLQQVFMEHFSFFGFDFNLAMNCVRDKGERLKYSKIMNCTEKEVAAHSFAWNKALQARKKFISDHPKKMEIAKKIIAARSDKKIITFNSTIAQCEKYGFGSVIHSKTKDNEGTLEQFSKQSSGVLHTSKMLDEGADIPGLSVAIVAGFNSSKTTTRQRIGRCIRKEGDKTAEVFFLVLKGCTDERWFKKANESLDYIEITEDELEDVLKGKPLKNKVKKTQEKFTGFRF